MEHVPPPAEELALLDRELAQLDARRAHLLTRRAWLVSALQPQAPQAPNAPRWHTPPVGHGWAPGQPWSAAPRAAKPSGPPRSAQNVLLTLGGLLLTVAAVAFTLVSWGSMGIGGRSAVLALVTLAALAAPVVLLRRKLAATAEALAALALVLTLLDTYAVHAVAAPDADGLTFTAVASAVLAALWAAYGLALGKLHLPLPAAVFFVQWPLLLGAWAAGAPAIVVGWALLVTAVVDGAIALWGKGLGVRVTAGIGLAVMGSAALLTGLGESLTAGGPLGAVLPGALLLTAAVAALAGAWRAPNGYAQAGGVVAGLAAVAAVGGVLRAAVPGMWHVPVYLLCGLALLSVVRAPLPRSAGRGVLAAAGAVVAARCCWGGASGRGGAAGAGRAGRRGVGGGAGRVPGRARGVDEVVGVGRGSGGARGGGGAARGGVPVVAVAGAGRRSAGHAGGDGARCGGRGGAGPRLGALLLAAATLGVPYPVAVALETVLVAGLLLVAVRGAELGAGDAGTGEGGGAGAGAGLRAVAGPPWR
ncbi:putative PE-PGRS family protein PE_PGRS33 [Streptomyces sp. KY70]|nr:putative PE-PGRS family protein PE_PGRS33 [Streptomyces sp. KY70]